VQEIGQDFFGAWEPGGSMVFLGFSSKTSYKTTKINGSVKVDGVPANYVTMGFYSSVSKDKKPRKVEITTDKGQNSTFTINTPTQKVKLLSVNGQTSNASIDLSKDVVLEFEDMPEDTKTPIMVQLSGSQIGVKTFFAVGYFLPKKKIVIPPAMFRNMAGAAEANIAFNGCYLQVSRSKEEKAVNVSGVYPEVKYGSMVNDGMFVNVTVKPTFNKGIEVKGQEGLTGYVATKSSAINSPNFDSMKTLGVMSFAAKGTTSFYDQKTKSVIGGGSETTTKTASFPQFPTAVWDDVLNQLYNKITNAIATEFNVKVVELNKITNSAAYKVASPYNTTPEENTKDEFFVTYKNTKSLSGLRPLAETYANNTTEHKIMTETGVNSLLKLILNFKLNFEGSAAYMTTTVDYELLAPVLGETYQTHYLKGSLSAPKFYLKKNEKISPADLADKVIYINGLTAAFTKALQDIKSKEKANGDYDVEWAVMNK
jgi:ribosomal protein L21E